MPVDLGGSPVRCALSPPRRPTPAPALVEALIHHYRDERCRPGDTLEVGFFHGGLPSDDLLSCCAGLPVRVGCSPADLSRAEASRLASRGVRLIELDVATFSPSVLRELRRGYTGAGVDTMRAGLAALGLEVGLVLMPGLPGASHTSALEDVDRAIGGAIPPAALVRLYPALALEGSELATQVESGRWRPMRLGEAVTTLVAMVDRLEAAHIPVARIGLQPGIDLPARAIAGPVHPNLRGLVEGRRSRRRMAEALQGVPPGATVELRVNPADLGPVLGRSRENLRAVRVALGLASLEVRPDPLIARGHISRN